MEVIQVGINFSHCIGVGREGLRECLALLWKDNLQVTLFSCTVGHIDVIVK